jgi:hypothetical protein
MIFVLVDGYRGCAGQGGPSYRGLYADRLELGGDPRRTPRRLVIN